MEKYPGWGTNEDWKKNYAPYIKWGLFYYNKNDKRLWVPKWKARSKNETTLNMAHTKAKLLFIGFIFSLLTLFTFVILKAH